MTEFERRITGRTIRAIEDVEDYIQVFFSGGGVLNLYNPVAPFSRRRLIGKTIELLSYDTKRLLLQVSDGSRLTMSCLDEDYVGPEAFYFKDSDGTMIVD